MWRRSCGRGLGSAGVRSWALVRSAGRGARSRSGSLSTCAAPRLDVLRLPPLLPSSDARIVLLRRPRPALADEPPPFPGQQTTVEEQSRIIQLEEELGLRKAEIQKLQARLGGADARSESPGREPAKEGGELGERQETARAASQREVESLKATVESKNQEISEMKLKIQQVSKENMEMMDMWKVSALLLPGFRERRRRKASPPPPAGGRRPSLGQTWFFSTPSDPPGLL